MPDVSGSAVAGTVAVVGLGTTLFSSFMPSMPVLRTEEINRENSIQVRHAEIVGAITTLMFAGVVGYWARSSIPLITGALTCVILSAAYEITLRQTGTST